MNTAIILAAGSGSRFGDGLPKQFQKLNGRMVIDYSVETFVKHPQIDHVIVVVPEGYVDRCQHLNANCIIVGGEDRHRSTKSGILACPEDTRRVLIHDAVRPFLSSQTISDCLDKLIEFDIVDVCCPSDDTVVCVDPETHQVQSIPDRSTMWRGQTPQGFRMQVLRDIYKDFDPTIWAEVTDNVGIATRMGANYSIAVVESTSENMKITRPYDLFLAERIMQFRTAEMSDPDVQGHRIAVFGGSGGIGSKVVRILTDAGALVYAPSHEDFNLVEEDWASRFKGKGGVGGGKWNSIVYCAGIMDSSVNLNTWYQLSAVHVESPMLLMQMAPEIMVEGGSLVFVGSSSFVKGREKFPLYSASKAALVNLVEGMAPRLERHNIRVNCVNPGLTQTPMVDQIEGGSDDSLSPEYVARAIVTYCQTGQTGQIVHVR